MDFGSWSPSHTILALFIIIGFVVQVAVLFYLTRQLEKRQDKQSEDLHQQGETFLHALERLEDRMDKRFGEVNQRLGETNQRIDGLRSEMTQGFSDVRSEMTTGFSDLRGEMNQRLSDMTGEISKLNQHHIDHLNRHSEDERGDRKTKS